MALIPDQGLVEQVPVSATDPTVCMIVFAGEAWIGLGSCRTAKLTRST
jgi:hypothetical protein